MPDKQIELIYSQQSGDFIAGRAYSNPRFFSTPRQGVAKVYLVGDWPNIREVYEAMGVPVERIDADAAMASPAGSATAPSDLFNRSSDEDRASTIIPADWADLAWSKPNADGLTLRGLGAVFSDTPVLKKADAIAAIQAEVDRRAAVPVTANADEVGSNGLTRREMTADLEALSDASILDPTLAIEELVEKYAAAKPKPAGGEA